MRLQGAGQLHQRPEKPRSTCLVLATCSALAICSALPIFAVVARGQAPALCYLSTEWPQTSRWARVRPQTPKGARAPSRPRLNGAPDTQPAICPQHHDDVPEEAKSPRSYGALDTQPAPCSQHHVGGLDEARSHPIVGALELGVGRRPKHEHLLHCLANRRHARHGHGEED